jgi:DNA-binding PadR family transcriptional regulator
MDDIERQAHRYADVGWHVLPVEPGGKRPVTKHGLHDATTDHRAIEKWWGRVPGGNVGVRTGAGFGPDALDVDRKPDGSGYPALRKLQAAGLVPKSPVVRTPSGGAHLLFTGSEQGNHSMPRQRLDYRGTGGYVVAAPSQIGGRTYQVLRGGPVEHSFNWQAAKTLLEPERQVERREIEPGTAEELTRLADWVSHQEHGNRNNGLHWAACRAAEHGLLDPAGVDRLVDAALRSGLRGGEREARATVESAMRGTDRRPFERETERGQPELEAR